MKNLLIVFQLPIVVVFVFFRTFISVRTVYVHRQSPNIIEFMEFSCVAYFYKKKSKIIRRNTAIISDEAEFFKKSTHAST